jgi:hypothetical protein
MQARPRRHADVLPWGNYVIGVGELRDRRALNWRNYVIADTESGSHTQIPGVPSPDRPQGRRVGWGSCRERIGIGSRGGDNLSGSARLALLTVATAADTRSRTRGRWSRRLRCSWSMWIGRAAATIASADRYIPWAGGSSDRRARRGKRVPKRFASFTQGVKTKQF